MAGIMPEGSDIGGQAGWAAGKREGGSVRWGWKNAGRGSCQLESLAGS